MPDKSQKRPRPSKKMRAKYEENRIKRQFLEKRIEELDEMIQRGLEPGSKTGEKRVLAWARERRRLKEQMTRLPVARKGRNGRRKGKKGEKSGQFAGSITPGQGTFGF